MVANWTYLIRFIAAEDGQVHLGDIDPKEFPDLGLATFSGKKITAKLISGSMYDGIVTSKTMTVERVRFPQTELACSPFANQKTSCSLQSP